MKKIVKDQLLRHPSVKKVTEKQVIFTPAFKKKAVQLHAQGLSADEIFQNEGIDPLLFIPEYCSHLIKKWVRKARLSGVDALSRDGRGKTLTSRTKKPRQRTVEELEDIIAFQAELIKQIKKMKALPKKN
jgi:transposase